jgi:hypothetical protein
MTSKVCHLYNRQIIRFGIRTLATLFKSNCQVSLENIFDESFTDQMCSISKCASKTCKTCDIDSKGRLTTTLCDKRDDFHFAIVNFPFLCSNIPLSPAYGVYISQFLRYKRACFEYEDFSKRGQLLTNKLMCCRVIMNLV